MTMKGLMQALLLLLLPILNLGNVQGDEQQWHGKLIVGGLEKTDSLKDAIHQIIDTGSASLCLPVETETCINFRTLSPNRVKRSWGIAFSSIFSVTVNVVNIGMSAACLGLSGRQMDQQLRESCASLHDYQCKKLLELAKNATELGTKSNELITTYSKMQHLSHTMSTMSNEYQEMVANYQKIKDPALESAFHSNQIQEFRDTKIKAYNITKNLKIDYQNQTINTLMINVNEIAEYNETAKQDGALIAIQNAGLAIESVSLAWNLWKLAGVELISKVYDKYLNKPKQSDLFIIDVVADSVDSTYTYKSAVDLKTGREYLIEETRLLSPFTDEIFDTKIIPLAKGKAKMKWLAMKGLSPRSKSGIIAFLDENWSTGESKLQILFENTELVKTLDENQILGDVLQNLDAIDDIKDIKLTVNNYDEINKMDIPSIEKAHLMREKFYTEDDILRVFFDDNTDLELIADRWKPKQQKAAPHWMEETGVEPGAIKKTQRFEKSKKRRQRNKMRKAFDGKDDLINFLFENNEYDRVMKYSVDLETKEYKKFVNDIDNDYKQLKESFGDRKIPKKELKSFKSEIKKKFDNPSLKKKAITGPRKKIINSNLKGSVKENLLSLAKSNQDKTFSFNIDRLMDYKNNKKLTDFLEKQKNLDLLNKLLNAAPDDFNKALADMDNLRENNNWRGTKDNAFKDKVLQLDSWQKVPKFSPDPKTSMIDAATNKVARTWQKTKLRHGIDESFGAWIKGKGTKLNSFASRKAWTTKWNTFKTGKKTFVWKGTKWIGKNLVKSLDFGMQIAGMVMCAIQIEMATKNEAQITENIEKQEQELSQTWATITLALGFAEGNYSEMYQDYNKSMDSIEKEIMFLSESSDESARMQRAIHETIDEKIGNFVLQNKTFEELKIDFKNAVPLMHRYNSVLHDHIKIIQRRLRTLQTTRESENGALEGRTLENIRKSLLDNGYTDSSFSNYDLLLTLANSNNEKINAMSSYQGWPLDCLRKYKISSQVELDSWMERNKDNKNDIKVIENLVKTKAPLSMLYQLAKGNGYNGTEEDMLAIVASVTGKSIYIDFTGNETVLPGSNNGC